MIPQPPKEKSKKNKKKKLTNYEMGYLRGLEVGRRIARKELAQEIRELIGASSNEVG